MAIDPQWRPTLTRLTRLAQREPEARGWIEEMLERNLPDIIGAAVEVAAETGPPMPELLAAVLERNASAQASEAVARSVPIDATALQDLAIAAIRSLLGQPGWPPGEAEPETARRRYALRVALATRLSYAGRLGEARAVAEQALSETGASLARDASVRARSIDAYDVIGEAQLASGDAEGAVRNARRALALRREIDDPFRLPAQGELRLGLALLRSGQAGEACRVLTEAAALARDLVETHRDALLELRDKIAELPPGEQLRIVVTMGRNPNGFDELIPDQAYLIESLIGLAHSCLGALAAVLESPQEVPADLIGPALAELAAGRAQMRRGHNDPALGLRILRLLAAWPQAADLTVDDFETMAGEAAAAGDLELTISVRQAEADFFRRAEPVDEWALVDALSRLSQLLADVRPAEAVTAMREAVDVVADGDPLELGLALHNLSRRLSANGQPEEGRDASARAVGLISEAAEAGRDLSPLVMTGMFETLVQRNLECGTEVVFTPPVVDSAVRTIDDFGREAGADLTRLAHATCGLFDSARRQGDLVTAPRIADAVSRLAVRRPDDQSIQVARGLCTSQLLWLAVESGQLSRARDLLREISEAERNAPDMDVLTVEHGICAADLIAAYGQADDDEAAAQVARESAAALLSPTYLAARRRDLGDDQSEFIKAIRQLTQR
jgi:tetratricopeptide (TPR) repeat protein